MSQKAAILVFCEKTRCFKFHSDGKYVLVSWQRNWASLSFISQKKQRLCILVARIVFLRTTLFSVSVTKPTLWTLYITEKCFGLLAAKFFVSVYFRVSYAVFRIHVWRKSLYLFSYINCAVNPLSYRKHVLGFWQLQWKLRALAHKRQQFGFSLQNTLL